MESSSKEKIAKVKSTVASTVSLRMKRETKRRVLAEVAKVNKKSFGKKVRVDELIGILLPMLNEAHIKAMQDSSMTNADRLEMQYRVFVSKHGQMSKDEYIGKLLSGDGVISEI